MKHIWKKKSKKEHKTSVNLVKLSIIAVNGDKYKAHWFPCVVAEGFGAIPSDGRTCCQSNTI